MNLAEACQSFAKAVRRSVGGVVRSNNCGTGREDRTGRNTNKIYFAGEIHIFA
jgi:hypothetical protein